MVNHPIEIPWVNLKRINELLNLLVAKTTVVVLDHRNSILFDADNLAQNVTIYIEIIPQLLDPSPYSHPSSFLSQYLEYSSLIVNYQIEKYKNGGKTIDKVHVRCI